MQMKQLLAVLSVFVFGASFAGQAYASSFSTSAPYERTYLKSSTPAPQAKLAEKYRAGMIPRFVKYVQIDSMSDNAAEWMTPGQEKMAQALYEDIRAFGFPTHFSEDKYIYVNIPSNLKNRKAPMLGISAHYDTTPDIIGNNVKPQVIKNYDGQPIALKNNHVIDFQSDPYLRNMIGKTIVTSDGTTNLGADDKAGVTIVVTLLQTLAENPKMPHGPIQVVITPNEDVGRSAERLELEYYHPDYAYDFDGGVEGEVVAANFSADRVVVTARGVNGHQSYAAENGYRNSVKPIGDLIAAAALPENLPNNSRGEQGYLEPHHIEYNASENTHSVDFRLRYFDQNEGKRYLQRIQEKADSISKALGVAIEMQVIKQYENVEYGVKPEALGLLKAAMQEAGVTPNIKKERAGTTSAMIMAKHGFGGYTVFTGQNNPHAFTEWLSEEDMFKAYQVALNLVKQVAQMKVSK